MLDQFARCVTEANPLWFLMENVPCVPDCAVPGYRVQRIDLDARECGSEQRRARHFQFGSREGMQITVQRSAVTGPGEAPVLAKRLETGRRDWPAALRLQGLPVGFALPGFTKEGKFRAVGNGVPVPIGGTRGPDTVELAFG